MSEEPLETSFTPISPNPYIVGNPVRGRAMFFGREAEFELVRRRFEHSTLGGLMVFCGERRSGKTSILFQILDGRLGSDFIPVLIDMQSMAVGNEVEFLTRVSEEILAALGPEAESIPFPVFGTDTTHSATFQKFILQVLKRYPTKKLILLFDEYELFENKIDAGQLSSDVFSILANLMENRPVFLVFTGSQHLEQRRRDYYRMLLQKSQHKMISFLEREDALSLIRKPVEGRVSYDDGVVETIWRLAAGQPFYTQAICQSLIDHLNERRTNQITSDALSAVVDGIVNNPLPQMIFLWDGLERDEKLVLALLAEQLVDSEAYADAPALLRLLRRRQYPLDLDLARVAMTLAKLFKNELLLCRDRAAEHEYAFRMDLWRLWIRRQHSVWQVMRELKLDIRRDGRRWQKAALIGLGVLTLFVVSWFVIPKPHKEGASESLFREPSTARFALIVTPESATISLDGQTIGFGRYAGSVHPGRDNVFRVSAVGYADTNLVVNLAPGASSNQTIALRERQGGLRIETRPSQADVRVDGTIVGRSPVTVRGLTSVRSHRVAATLAGHGDAVKDIVVAPDTTTSAILVLEMATTYVLVSTDPAGADVRIDGRRVGKAPYSVDGLSVGRHTFSVSRDGYLRAETTLAVTRETRTIDLELRAEPPGVLIVRGDRPAEIYIGGALAVANVQNSGRQELRPGTHRVRVVFADGAAIDSSVIIKSGERATYDYSHGTIVHSPDTRP